MKERARRLERRLGTLDSEYSQQLEQLRSAYHKSINADLQGDSIRQRYQAEIEQLRVLCEKGLLAMESSHRRIIQELEDKHRAEREQLKLVLPSVIIFSTIVSWYILFWQPGG